MVIDKLRDMNGYDLDRLRKTYLNKIEKTEAKINNFCIELESMKETLDSIKQLQCEQIEQRTKDYESVNPFDLEDDEYEDLDLIYDETSMTYKTKKTALTRLNKDGELI